MMFGSELGLMKSVNWLSATNISMQDNIILLIRHVFANVVPLLGIANKPFINFQRDNAHPRKKYLPCSFLWSS